MLCRRLSPAVRQGKCSKFWLLALAASLGSGCAQEGGQTGDGSDLNTGPQLPPEEAEVQPEGSVATGAASPDCNTESEPIEDADATVDELGFAPSELLSWLTEPAESSLAWGDAEFDGGATPGTGPETGESGIRIEISYEGGAINLLTAGEATGEGGGDSDEPPPEGPIAEGPAIELASASSGLAEFPCPPEVEIEVLVQVTSDGGALDESFTTFVRASAANTASFRHQIPVDELGGKLTFTGDNADRWELSAVVIDAVLTPSGTSGTIQLNASGRGDLAGVASAQSAAVWPAPGECGEGLPGGGIVVDDEHSLGDYDVGDSRDVFGELGALPLFWDDGQSTELQIDVAPHDLACVWPHTNGSQSVRFVADVDLTSDDGRIDGEFLAEASVDADAMQRLGYGSLNVSLSRVEPSVAAETFGLSDDVSFDGFDWAEFYFDIWRDVQNDTVSGSLGVFGVIESECAENPPEPTESEDGLISVQGCAGNEMQLLLQASVGNNELVAESER
jgi:hypothetical protein